MNEKKEAKIKLLIDSLHPTQKEHLDSLMWLYNQQRGAGKTYLLCVIGLIQTVTSGRGWVVDHHPYKSDPMGSYIRNMIHGIAEKFGLEIGTKKLEGNVIEITLLSAFPEYFWKEEDKNG